MADSKVSAPGSIQDSGAERRRSHRVQIAMALLIRGASGGSNFEEDTKTISVSAHGCMVRLSAKVARGQNVVIVNKKTAEEATCTVSYIGQADGGKVEVGIEFTEPSPVFWRIAFPPENWDPSERKRATTSQHTPLPKLPRRQ